MNAAGGEALLRVEGLSAGYGDVEAVRGVSLTVAAGRMLAVIGPNGAGKTTLLSAIAGLLPPRSGEVVLGDERLTGASVEDNVARGMSLVPETRELFGGLTVLDNLLLGAFTLSRRRRRERDGLLAEVLRLFPRLDERRGQLAGTLSGGERQMLALGRALMAKPRLLLLDEPSLGLAPRVTREILAAVSALRGAGVAVLLVEQNARAALRLADEAIVLEHGEVVLAGPARQLEDDPRVVESYLGLAEGNAAADGDAPP